MRRLFNLSRTGDEDKKYKKRILGEDNSQEEFLFKIMPFVSYIMSVQAQELVPVSNNILNNKQSGDFRHNTQIQKIQIHVAKKIILPIIEKDSKKPNPLSDKKINDFTKSCLNLSDILKREYKMEQLMDSDMKHYDKITLQINDNTVMSRHSKEEALQIIEILKDYQTNMVPIVNKRLPLLEEAIHQIDIKDLLKSLYGSLLSFVCIGTLLGVPNSQSKQKFETLAHQGHELAKNLDNYTDTLDILTNPDELDFLNKSESN